LTEAPTKSQPQQKKVQNNSDDSTRQKIVAAKSTLGLRDVNVPVALSGHKKVKNIVGKNPSMPFNQVLNRLTPNERSSYITVSSKVPVDSLEKDVSMSQFRRQLQTLRPSGKKSLMNSVEFSDKEQLCEASLIDELSPPPMLVLKRTGIRIFPDGRRVAMYTNQKYGLVFTVPYKGTAGTEVIPGVQSEETEIMESLEHVAKYAQEESPKQTSRHIKFSDGSKLRVSHGAAKAIHMVHGALNDENKKKYSEMLKDPKGFEKAAHFALSRVKFTIGGE
jgi:hypothetical protein